MPYSKYNIPNVGASFPLAPSTVKKKCYSNNIGAETMDFSLMVLLAHIT